MIASVEVSALYISLHALLFLALGWGVVSQRQSKAVNIGDDGSPEMLAAVRAHANTVEWVPIVLLLLLTSELLGFGPVFLHIAGSALFLARIAYTYGFLKTQGGVHQGRFFGTLITWVVLLVLSVANILAVVGIV